MIQHLYKDGVRTYCGLVVYGRQDPHAPLCRTCKYRKFVEGFNGRPGFIRLVIGKDNADYSLWNISAALTDPEQKALFTSLLSDEDSFSEFVIIKNFASNKPSVVGVADAYKIAVKLLRGCRYR